MASERKGRETRMRRQEVRFGVVGAGRIAVKQIGPAIKSARHATLHAAASRDPARAEALGPVRTYHAYDDLIRDPEVDAVFIAAHNGLHKTLAIDALRNGKHVLCEKPLAVNARECEEMIAAAEAVGRHLVEAFMYRYHPQMDKAQELVRQGAIGDVRIVQASFRFHLTRADDVRFRPEWGGGSLLDVGCYCVDISRLFLGDTPREVRALGVLDPVRGVDTSVQGILRYDSGRFALISCGFDSGPLQQVVLLGTDGVIHFNQPFSSWRGNPQLTIQTAEREEVLPFDPVNTYQAEVEDLALAILRGSSPKLHAREALSNARILDRLAQEVTS
jgi:predicted dehydrogenase